MNNLPNYIQIGSKRYETMELNLHQKRGYPTDSKVNVLVEVPYEEHKEDKEKPMAKTYKVYAIADEGNGHVQQMQDWDGNDILELHVGAYARDAVISIEPFEDDESNES